MKTYCYFSAVIIEKYVLNTLLPLSIHGGCSKYVRSRQMQQPDAGEAAAAPCSQGRRAERLSISSGKAPNKHTCTTNVCTDTRPATQLIAVRSTKCSHKQAAPTACSRLPLWLSRIKKKPMADKRASVTVHIYTQRRLLRYPLADTPFNSSLSPAVGVSGPAAPLQLQVSQRPCTHTRYPSCNWS